MLNYIKKHWICSTLVGIVLLYHLYFGVSVIMIKINSGRNWHPMVVAQPGKTIFEYKLPKTKYPTRCFELALDMDDLDRKYPEIDSEFDQKFRYRAWEDMSDEEYVSHIQGKPHFIARIYQAGELKYTQKIYMMSKKSSSSAYVGGFKMTRFSRLAGYDQTKQRACYEFLPDLVYTIEVINQTPLAEFQNIDAFVGVRAQRVKY